MNRADKPSLRECVLSLLGPRASRFLAARLLQEGGALWSGDPESLLEAIDKVERAQAPADGVGHLPEETHR